MSSGQRCDVADFKGKKESKSKTSKVGTKRLVTNSDGVKESEPKKHDKTKCKEIPVSLLQR